MDPFTRNYKEQIREVKHNRLASVDSISEFTDMDDFDDRCESINLDSGISIGYSSIGSCDFSTQSHNQDEKLDHSITKLDHSITKLDHLDITDTEFDDGYASISNDVSSCNSGLNFKSQSLNRNQSEHIHSSNEQSQTFNKDLWQDQYGDTKLHSSIIHENEPISLEIIFTASSHHLEIQNDCLQTPLHLAVITNQPKIVTELIRCGAKTNIRERNGNSPLNIACAKGYIECINALYFLMDESVITKQQFQSDATIMNYSGETCLHLALKNGNMDVIIHLSKFGVDFNLKEGLSGKSLLHYLIESENCELLQTFLSNCKFDHDVKTFAGLTAIQIAKSRKLENMVELLKFHGAKDYPLDSASDYSSSDSEIEMQLENGVL